MTKKTVKQKIKPIDFENYDKFKYQSWLQQRYAQLLGQEILLKGEIEEYLSSEKEKKNGQN